MENEIHTIYKNVMMNSNITKSAIFEIQMLVKQRLNKEVRPAIYNEEMLLKDICECFEVSQISLKGKTRLREIADVRHLFFYYAYKMFLGYISISRSSKLLNRHHTTLLHGKNKIFNLLEIGDSRIKSKLLKFEEFYNDKYKN